ncbi:MAG TPA: DUF6305 family protein [Thermotogota bacterium]|nr:DUF6305 family protein [Thermotogota bacterium]HRW93157.1 DUF6305 family protein [Thermotogota bacterium]
MKKIVLLVLVLGFFAFAGFGEMLFEFPVVLTSAGQSDEVNTVIYLAEEVGILYDYCDILSADEFAAGVGLAGAGNAPGKHVTVSSAEAKGTPFKTLLIAIGASLKGMGASGLSVNDEEKRIDALLDYAEANNIAILAMAIGGEIRRGLPGSPNEAMIDAVAPRADMIIVTADTNMDGRFTKIAEENGVEFIQVDSAFDLLETMPAVFGL